MNAIDSKQRAATAREHLAVARERLEVADIAPGPSEMAQVAASNAILSGIAAADAICGTVLGECSSDPDHRAASQMLRRVQGADGLAAKLQQLVADKTAIQYGGYCTNSVARASVARAEALVNALQQHGL
ncbi:hypothetical protein GCM10010435_64870 [Winogradskya consettensis]|uniref:HEPN domain-containing protein n=1 Tax=Winogradskya consettensis TaxID=113560 RepID=A0A919VMZ7_9ACTN|nr:hypothetical protein [Actinoplanes consettensis]GIM72204.1 hypothetical protein Aco04nite_29090 [Actinoplanes consettensis]